MMRKLFLTAMAAMAAVHPLARGEILIQDDFKRGAPAAPESLSGVSPAVSKAGEVAWIAAADWKTDGSAAVNEGGNRSASCFLPFSPEAGKIYELSATVTATDSAEAADNWVGIGFSPEADSTRQLFSPELARNGILLRPDNQVRGSFDGKGGLLKAAVLPGATLSVILDTTREHWSLAWKVNGEDAGTVRVFTENPAIRYVGFGNYKSAAGRIENFTLSVREDGEASHPAGGKPLKVFVFAGQSNMVGMRSQAKDLPVDCRGEIPGIQFFDGTKWGPLKAGATEPKGFGPEISFAQKYAAKTGEPIGVIKHSVGGTTLAVDWNPAAADTNLYDELLAKVWNAQESRPIEIAGVIWMQGESDGKKAEWAEAYGKNLADLIGCFRKEFGNPHLPFVCGRVNPPLEVFPQVGKVRKVQEECAIPGYAVINLDDLTKCPDRQHYDTAGIVEMGRRVAEATWKLQKGETVPPPLAAPLPSAAPIAHAAGG